MLEANPYRYEITPPEVIRAIPKSHELQLARQNYLHRCVHLVHAAKWRYLVLKITTNAESYDFSLNQLVLVPVIWYVLGPFLTSKKKKHESRLFGMTKDHNP